MFLQGIGQNVVSIYTNVTGRGLVLWKLLEGTIATL